MIEEKKLKSGISGWMKFVLVIVSFLFVGGMDYFLQFSYRLSRSLGVSLPSSLGWYPFFILVLFFIVFIIVKLVEKKSFKNYGFCKPIGKDITLFFVFFFLLMILAFLGRIIDPSYDAWYANISGIGIVSGLIIFCITMPLYVLKEELIERSFFQVSLRTYGFWWMALAISLNFAFAHFFVPDNGIRHVIVWAISVFIGSFALIAFFDMTRNFWLSMVLHLVFNIIIGLQIFLHVSSKLKYFEYLLWIVLLIGSVWALFHSKDIVKKYRTERLLKLPWQDYVFLILFSIVYPLLLLKSMLWLGIGVVMTCWVFFIKSPKTL